MIPIPPWVAWLCAQPRLSWWALLLVVLLCAIIATVAP